MNNETKDKTSLVDVFLASSSKTKIASILFIIAKLLGMASLPIAFAGYRIVGKYMLVSALISCTLAIGLCLLDLRKQKTQDEKREATEDELIERLLKEGRLQQKIQDARKKLVA